MIRMSYQDSIMPLFMQQLSLRFRSLQEQLSGKISEINNHPFYKNAEARTQKYTKRLLNKLFSKYLKLSRD